MEKKRIAIYLESTESTGGVNRVSTQLAEALLAFNLEVLLISRYKGKFGLFSLNDRVKFVEIFESFHSKYLTYFVERHRLRNIIRDYNIDILISTGGMFYMIATGLPVKHIVWDHVSFWHGNKIHHWLRRFAARNANAVVTLTDANLNAYNDLKGTKTLLHKINNPAMWKIDKRADMRSKQIISLGYIGEQKGYDLLIEAWYHIPLPIRQDWKLKIAGGDEGDRIGLENRIKELGISEIEFLGFRSDVQELLLSSSIYVMSSRWEGMPMVLLEAQACGLPIISYNCKTGPAEILTDDSGILVTPEAIKELGEALASLMVDYDKREAMSIAAKENVKRFSMDNIVMDWMSLFNQIQ